MNNAFSVIPSRVRTLRRLSVAAVFCSFVFTGTSSAQIGDVPEEGPQVPLPAVRTMKREPALSPAEELHTFRLEPGFRIELVAAEPLVRDPVAAAFDLEGNLWVVEMNNYNVGLIKDLPTLAAGASAAAIESCKIIKLESSRHDGHFDRRTVWLDGLERARGIAIVHDGILIADSPNLWLARDVHGVGHCDEKTKLLSTYEAWSDPEESGSLLWGRDNIIHDIDYAYDYRFRHGTVQPMAVPIRGQFGLSQDDFGRLFFNRNSDQLHADLFAPYYAVRNPHVTEIPWGNVRIAKDQEVWPSHSTPAINRAYRRGALGQQTGGLRDDGTLLEFTAACSPLIYRGANFGADYYGNAFVPEPAANLIKRNLLQESDGELKAVFPYRGREFLTSTDSRFRPVALLNAPDGSMVVLDMYRGLLQEYHYVTTYLRDQTLGRGLEDPISGRGRIFRIVREGGPIETKRPDLAKRGAGELADLLGHPSAWWRDTAEQEIVERGDHAADPALKRMALQAPSERTRVYALWTLDGLDALTPGLLKEALGDQSAKVRAAAVRLHERWLAGDTSDAMVEQLSAVVHDAAPEVAVQLALTLGESRSSSSLAKMEELLFTGPAHPFLPKAIASGLNGRELDFFTSVARRIRGSEVSPQTEAMLTILAAAIVHRGESTAIQSVVRTMADEAAFSARARAALMAGFESLGKAPFRRSIGLTRIMKSAQLAPLTASTDADLKTRATRLAATLAREEEVARQRAASAKPLTSAEQRLYEQGKVTYQMCAACHQPTGTGLPGVAPSLVDSHWVAGYPEVLVRIVLNGKEGTPGFPGAMPTIGATLSDEQLAGLLTYIRNSWDLQFGAVTPNLVARIRQEVGTRQAAWNDAELRRMENQTARDHARHPELSEGKTAGRN